MSERCGALYPGDVGWDARCAREQGHEGDHAITQEGLHWSDDLGWAWETLSEAVGEMGSGDRNVPPEDALEAFNLIELHYKGMPNGTVDHESLEWAVDWLQEKVMKWRPTRPDDDEDERANHEMKDFQDAVRIVLAALAPGGVEEDWSICEACEDPVPPEQAYVSAMGYTLCLRCDRESLMSEWKRTAKAVGWSEREIEDRCDMGGLTLPEAVEKVVEARDHLVGKMDDRPDSGERGTTDDGIPYRRHSWAGWVLVRERLHCACGHDYRDHTSHGCPMCDCDREVVPAWAYDEELPSRLRTGAGEQPTEVTFTAMPLCEAGHVYLKPGKPYLFYAVKDCHSCAALAKEAEIPTDHPDPSTEGEDCPSCGGTGKVWEIDCPDCRPDPSTRSEGCAHRWTQGADHQLGDPIHCDNCGEELTADPAPTGSEGEEVTGVIVEEWNEGGESRMEVAYNLREPVLAEDDSRRVIIRRLRSTSEGGRETLAERLREMAEHPAANVHAHTTNGIHVRASLLLRRIADALDGSE